MTALKTLFKDIGIIGEYYIYITLPQALNTSKETEASDGPSLIFFASSLLLPPPFCLLLGR